MKYYFFIFACIHGAFCFNLDLSFPTIISNPDRDDPDSLFGQVVRLFEDTNGPPYVLVGAPRATSKVWSEFEKPGQMFKCEFGPTTSKSAKYCQPYSIGGSRSIAARNRHKTSGSNNKVLDADEYDNMLFGSTIEVEDKSSGLMLVCGPRYFIELNQCPVLGICFFSNVGTSVNDRFNLIELSQEHFKIIAYHKTTNTSFDFYNTGYAEMGLSAHFTDTKEHTVILGAPGIHHWSGGLATVKLVEGRNASVQLIGKGLNSVYLGYSLTSIRLSTDEILYVAGAPRTNEGKGAVYLTGPTDHFPIKESYIKNLNMKQILHGRSPMEFFGSAVLTVSYSSNNPESIELLVGAPQYSSSKNNYDEGKVYVYRHDGKAMELVEKNGQDGLYVKGTGGRFGTTMASIGDIDGDGFTDVAIAAPFEDGVGAVYIFKGSSHGVEFKPMQHIKGKSFVHADIPISGFGISIDSQDIDKNRYPDIAIGSFRSGHVVVLRSRPVISVDLTLTASPSTFGINYTSNDNTFQLKACVKYNMSSSERAKPSSVCAVANLKYDIPPPANPRIELVDMGNIVRNATIRWTRNLQENLWECKEFTVRLNSQTIQERNAGKEPLKFEVEVELLGQKKKACVPFLDPKIKQTTIYAPGRTGVETEAPFCETCPVLKPGDSLVKKLSVPIVNDCGKEGICISDLSIAAEFQQPLPEGEYVLGKHKQAKLTVGIVNSGPHVALASFAIIDWDGTSGVMFSKASACSFFPEARRPHVRCDLKQILAPGDQENIEIVFDISETHALSFDVVAEVFLQNTDKNRENNRASAICKLVSVHNVAVVGSTKYIREANLFDKTVPESIVEFKQRFQIVKTGPSPVKQVEIAVTVPRVSTNVLEMTVKSNDGQCVFDKSSVPIIGPDTEGTTESPIGGTDDYDIIPEPDINIPNRRKREVSDDDSKWKKPDSSYNLHCGARSVACDRHICTFKDLVGEQNRTIELEGRFRPYEIRSKLDNHDQVLIKTEAVLESVGVVSNQKNDFYASVLQSNVQALPSWVIPVAVCGALLLLILITYVLYKVGFFKRKKIPKPDAEQENLNEAECPPDEQPPPSDEPQQT